MRCEWCGLEGGHARNCCGRHIERVPLGNGVELVAELLGKWVEMDHDAHVLVFAIADLIRGYKERMVAPEAPPESKTAEIGQP